MLLSFVFFCSYLGQKPAATHHLVSYPHRRDNVALTVGVYAVSATLQASARVLARSWPRLYSASHMPMHAAPHGLHRVVVPVRGAILARIVDVDQTAFLYPDAAGVVPAAVDVFHPDVNAYPALRLLSGSEVLVRDVSTRCPQSACCFPWGRAVPFRIVGCSFCVIECS